MGTKPSTQAASARPLAARARKVAALALLLAVVAGCATGQNDWGRVCKALDANPAQFQRPQVVTTWGWYERSSNTIYLAPGASPGVLLHELAHAVMSQEGLPGSQQEGTAQKVEMLLYGR